MRDLKSDESLGGVCGVFRKFQPFRDQRDQWYLDGC